MPRIWSNTIEEHRDAVREAVLDAAGKLVAETGLTGISMAAVAENTGIGRGTLYKYFPDIEALLEAWHVRHVGAHLSALARAQEAHAAPVDALAAVIRTYARIVNESARQGSGGTAAAMLHRSAHADHARRRLLAIVEDVMSRGIEAGVVRSDMSASELANFALAALDGARGLSRAGVGRLVELTLAALQKRR